jgi:hypothetical protein
MRHLRSFADNGAYPLTTKQPLLRHERSLTAATAFLVTLICAAAAKSTAPVHVPLPLMHNDKAQPIRCNTCLEQGKILGDRNRLCNHRHY